MLVWSLLLHTGLKTHTFFTHSSFFSHKNRSPIVAPIHFTRSIRSVWSVQLSYIVFLTLMSRFVSSPERGRATARTWVLSSARPAASRLKREPREPWTSDEDWRRRLKTSLSVLKKKKKNSCLFYFFKFPSFLPLQSWEVGKRKKMNRIYKPVSRRVNEDVWVSESEVKKRKILFLSFSFFFFNLV